MSDAIEKLHLISADPDLKNACTEVVLITATKEPCMLLEYDTYKALSSAARDFVDRYDRDGEGDPVFNFFEDLYKWGVLTHDPDRDQARPTTVSILGNLLIDQYLELAYTAK